MGDRLIATQDALYLEYVHGMARSTSRRRGRTQVTHPLAKAV